MELSVIIFLSIVYLSVSIVCAVMWHDKIDQRYWGEKDDIAQARIKLFFFLTPIALIFLGLWMVIRGIPKNFKIGVLKKLD